MSALALANAAVAAALLSPLAAQDAKLGRTEARELREWFATVLAEPDPSARRKALSRAEELGKQFAFDSLRDALREGPLVPKGAPAAREVGGEHEVLTEVGSTLVGYAFVSDGRRLRYAVDLPRGYDGKARHPVLLDPGHGTGKSEDDRGKAGFLEFYRGELDEAKLRDFLVVRTEIVEQIGGDGVQGQVPDDEAAAAFDAMFRDLASRFSIDVDRAYVSGLSQTGYWAWYLGRYRSDRWAGLAPMSAVSWQADAYLGNFQNVPVRVIHGERDANCAPEGPRATTARLAQLGFDVTYTEIEEAGHDPSVWNRLDVALAELGKRAREPYPKRVSKSLSTTRDGWCHWVRVDELKSESEGKASSPPTGGIDGWIDGQSVHLVSEGVERITLCLSRELVDLDATVEVHWNGERVYRGKLVRSFTTLAALAAEKVDWTATFEASIELKAP